MAFPLPAILKNYHHDVYPAIDPSREKLSAAGKFVVITGGGSGIGPHIAEAFGKAGAAKIALLGRTEKTLLATKQSLESKYPAQVSIHIADVSQEAAVNQAFQQLKATGPIDVLVSNAGYLPEKLSMADADVDDWWRAYEVNVKPALFLTRAFLKNAAQDAALIHISSSAAHVPPVPGFSAYASSKLASTKFFEYFQFEHPELRVFNIQPGIIDTEMSKKGTTGNDVSSTWAKDSHQLPAHFCVWLVSPEAAFLKGRFLYANWDVDEIKANVEEIESGNLFRTGLTGFY